MEFNSAFKGLIKLHVVKMQGGVDVDK